MKDEIRSGWSKLNRNWFHPLAYTARALPGSVTSGVSGTGGGGGGVLIEGDGKSYLLGRSLSCRQRLSLTPGFYRCHTFHPFCGDWRSG